MAVASANQEKIELPQSMESMPSPLNSKACSESGSDISISGNGDQIDRNEQSDSSVSNRKDVDNQYITIQAAVKSEEYRQLFHLPPEEVLVQDFNCALQDNFLLQGHMYLFVHHICFYSNIFGFETKKIIPINEVTCVRKAKTAAIFPNAIEIVAGGKKHFFASFLSRDEAYKLILDGWTQHGIGGKVALDHLDSKSESGSQDNTLVIVEKGFKQPVSDLQSLERNKSAHISEDYMLLSNEEGDLSSSMRFSEAEENGEEAEPVVNTECLSSREPLKLKLEDADAPKIPETYTMVAESKFPVQVEDFFNLFFSDDAVEFTELFHKNCGDKAFRCTSWSEHEQFGHARDMSFQHPIKLYFGARYGNCQQLQKFRIYKDSHLVIETSQEINDVPYGDCFHVEGLWDVEKDGDKGNTSCILHVYIRVQFSKKTMWKGKIEQSTIAECREAYTIWIKTAHERVKQKNVAKLEESCHDANATQNDAQLETHAKTDAPSEGLHDVSKLTEESNSKDGDTQFQGLLQGSSNGTTLFGESLATLCSYLKSQSHFPLVLFATSVLILLLMQLSIVVLLTRAPQVHVISQVDYMNGVTSGIENKAADVAWLEKRVHHLKDEMLMVEARLERMRHEHELLKAQLLALEPQTR
ncbi:protein VASCULAR ASSOCIATED DEATH 1, chloroplastic-like [Telopea speciosissima]|uniref:protein VASCULAR ASSOCIATED DEATH 1, chloroplastic-like n=1 Tax=Telopea speciosissima TaxID=54955 RepID=UPI001CC36E7E|nr:protein VASCULAR ASSOCIATED DEATH 1, chloroplastic-like [Telopea speciosissima]XP_043717214.1 protein VASCULAR ASSOCIATED DEATH 1, chloroplastic-like [Telopea speciosissima]